MMLQHAHSILKHSNSAIKILEKHFAFSKGGLTKPKKIQEAHTIPCSQIILHRKQLRMSSAAIY